MKDERMAVLDMLNRQIITAKEARELIEVLQKSGNHTEAKDTKKDDFEKFNESIDKVNDTFKKTVKKANEKIEKVQPVVKDVAEKVTEKVSEKIDEAEPVIKNFTTKLGGLFSDFKDEIQEVKNKRNAQRDMFNELDEEDIIDGEDIENELDELDELENENIENELDDEQDNIIHLEDNKTLESLQIQLDEIQDVESFLKSAFGDEALEDYNKALNEENEDDFN